MKSCAVLVFPVDAHTAAGQSATAETHITPGKKLMFLVYQTNARHVLCWGRYHGASAWWSGLEVGRRSWWCVWMCMCIAEEMAEVWSTTKTTAPYVYTYHTRPFSLPDLIKHVQCPRARLSDQGM